MPSTALQRDRRAATMLFFAFVVGEFFAIRKLHEHWAAITNHGFESAYQAVAAIVIGWATLIFACAAAYAALRSASASEAQAVAAVAQANAANEQAAAARSQVAFGRIELMEQIRPILAIEKSGLLSDLATNFWVKNVGAGSATITRFQFRVGVRGQVADQLVEGDYGTSLDRQLIPGNRALLVKPIWLISDPRELRSIYVYFSDQLGTNYSAAFFTLPAQDGESVECLNRRLSLSTETPAPQ